MRPESAYTKFLTQINATLSSLLHGRYSIWILGVISFVESALPIPIITDPFMVAYILAHRSRVVLGVLVTTATSLLGGLAAYLVTAFFTDTLLSLLNASTLTEFTVLKEEYAGSGLLLGFLGAITPVPFTLAAMVAGAMHSGAIMFLIGAGIGRIIRYGFTGYLTYRFGAAALKIAEKHIWPITFIAGAGAIVYLWFTL
jgi:membrane protein YqaA with SNARE-associated domain